MVQFADNNIRAEDIDQNICSIRNRSVPTSAEMRGSRDRTRPLEDDDPGLRRSGDFKEKQMHINNRDPREASLIEMKRHLSSDLEKGSRYLRGRLETSKIARAALKIMGVLAVTMVIADGVLTPAQSVLGAVQGIQVVNPDISKGMVIGVTDAVLVLLFCIQPLGITKITFAFSPVVIIWLGLNAVFRVYNLAKYDAGVFRAFNPLYAFESLVRNGQSGWSMLGGILLAFTGVEALFADLGAFSRKAVQISWLFYVFPGLLLAYIGQAAFISVHPEAHSNPFFPLSAARHPLSGFSYGNSSSHSCFTGNNNCNISVMKLSYFPQLKVTHTSKVFHGQLFIPVANWLFLIGTILTASIFNNTVSLGNAYGVCVMFVTFFDTCMVTLAAVFVWRIHPALVVLPWVAIASLDGVFLSSALTKVPGGAWFTLALASLLAFILLLWRFGKEQQWFSETEDRFPTTHFVTPGLNGQMCLSSRFDGSPISSTKGVGIFFDKAGETTPIVFSQFVLKLTAIPDVKIFLHLRPLETPSVGEEDRYSVSRLAIPNGYRLIIRYGFNEEIMTSDLASLVVEQIRGYLNEGRSADLSSDSDANICTWDAELSKLDIAHAHKLIYTIGKEQMKIKAGTNFARKFLLNTFLWLRENTRSKIANLGVPIDMVIEVGFLKAI
ncbi:hypothetical protein FQN57_001472 [Myotisia sp. PD_48]|nr:hypothetical protein FQN57_001472 [Myotisia sp. PD_48]